jgi:hypothetical protein
VIDGFNHLTDAIKKDAPILGGVLLSDWIVAASSAGSSYGEEFGRFFSADVSFISQNAQIGMIASNRSPKYIRLENQLCQYNKLSWSSILPALQPNLFGHTLKAPQT